MKSGLAWLGVLVVAVAVATAFGCVGAANPPSTATDPCPNGGPVPCANGGCCDYGEECVKPHVPSGPWLCGGADPDEAWAGSSRDGGARPLRPQLGHRR